MTFYFLYYTLRLTYKLNPIIPKKKKTRKNLEEYGGTLNLMDRWARHVLTKMEWTKRKGTAGKLEPSPQFLAEEKFTFQRAISAAISEHDIPTSLVINLDQRC